MKSKFKIIKKWEDRDFDNIIDVRSPSEYEEDHIIGAINCPVLFDEQRAQVGTIYKKESTFKAKIIGSTLTARNIAKHVEEKFMDNKGAWQPLIYCWRGGQRSKSFAIVLSEIGWRTYQLEGGYKRYRNEVINFLNKTGPKLNIILISGKTGSAKTKILQNLKSQGAQILDLENLASHKGSLLGKIPGLEQPSQKLFESKLYHELKKLDLRKKIYVEAESSKIGNVHVPKTIWATMINSPRIEIKADLELRANFLLKDYEYMCKKPELIKPIINGLQKRLSKKLINDWLQLIDKKNWLDLTKSFLENHYDPSYSSNTIKNDRKIIKQIEVKSFSDNEIKRMTDTILN